MTPEDVGYCRTSLTSGVLYLLLFSVLAIIILYQCFAGYFRCELLFIGIVTFVNLGKTNPDFPNNGVTRLFMHGTVVLLYACSMCEK